MKIMTDEEWIAWQFQAVHSSYRSPLADWEAVGLFVYGLRWPLTFFVIAVLLVVKL